MSRQDVEDTDLEIGVQSVKQFLDESRDFLLIDCREQAEYEHCRIEGSVLIPMNQTRAKVLTKKAVDRRPL